MKTGLIDVGGGLRGVYAAGVLDRCLDEGVRFDYGIGISAGSANLASFLAGQRGRNLRFFRDYSQRKAYMGLGNLLHGRGFLDLQYIYGTLSVSGGEDPLDYLRIAANPTEWYVAATEAGTGKPHYFRPGDLHQDDYRILMASSAIPVVALAQDYARQGKLLIVAPDDTCGVRTLSRDRDALLRLYEKGLRDGQKIPAFLRP